MQLKLFDDKTLDDMVRQGKRNRYFYELEFKELYKVPLPSNGYWEKVMEYELQRGMDAYIQNKEYFDKLFRKQEGFLPKLKRLYMSFTGKD